MIQSQINTSILDSTWTELNNLPIFIDPYLRHNLLQAQGIIIINLEPNTSIYQDWPAAGPAPARPRWRRRRRSDGS